MRKITLASQASLAYSFVATPILYLSEVSSETEGDFFFVSVAVSTSSSFYRHRWNDELNFLGGVQVSENSDEGEKKKKKDQTKYI